MKPQTEFCTKGVEIRIMCSSELKTCVNIACTSHEVLHQYALLVGER